MKIAILSSASAGGAGIAAYRIYEAFKEHSEIKADFFDIDAFMETVDQKISPQISATNQRYTNTHFTIDYATEVREWVIDLFSDYDLINIHWASYLVSISEILKLAEKGLKILFTLHDFYYLTGGCHYPAGCTGYYDRCINCPQLNSLNETFTDVLKNKRIKQKLFGHKNVFLSAPSKFIVQNAVHSKTIPAERAFVLRNSYQSITSFQSKDISFRSILLIADSFNEKRKGLQLAVDSLKLASVEYQKKQSSLPLILHLLGGVEQEIVDQLDDYPIKIIKHGHVKEHYKLVEVFQNCHYILTCSYEDNWPNVLVESGCYGCLPIVGKWHGCEEFGKVFKVTDFIAESYTPIHFSNAILNALITDDTSLLSKNKVHAKEVRKVHEPKKVVENYLKVVNENSKCQFEDYKKATSVNYLFDDRKEYNVKSSPFGIQDISKYRKNHTEGVSNYQYGLINLYSN